MRRAAAAGMLRGDEARRSSSSSAPLLLLVVVVLLAAAQASALPLQYLPEIPGYIPVYIRHGDQPLEEINPALAEAFHESSGILKSIREIRLDEPTPEIPNKDLTDRNDVALDSKEENKVRESAKSALPPKQLIYSLPRVADNLPLKPKPTEKESFVMKIHKSPAEKADAKKAKDAKK